MKSLLPFLPLLAVASASAAAEPRSPCEGIEASAAVYRLADLPAEIRDDLNKLSENSMADAGASIRRTDAPTGEEKDLPPAALVHGLRVGPVWFVSYEIGEYGFRTIGYTRAGNGPFVRSPSHYFGGPPCESIRAALKGVRSPGGFGF